MDNGRVGKEEKEIEMNEKKKEGRSFSERITARMVAFLNSFAD